MYILYILHILNISHIDNILFIYHILYILYILHILHILHIDDIFAVSQRELSNQGTLWTPTSKFLETKKLIQDASVVKQMQTDYPSLRVAASLLTVTISMRSTMQATAILKILPDCWAGHSPLAKRAAPGLISVALFGAEIPLEG
jgi:hypothetical protein